MTDFNYIENILIAKGSDINKLKLTDCLPSLEIISKHNKLQLKYISDFKICLEILTESVKNN